MGRYYLRAVAPHRFRSFEKRSEIQLPRSGMVLIDCVNRDTGGKSAAGKTNVGLAISQGFDYCPIPSTQLQSWHSKQAFSVDYAMDTDAGYVTWRVGAGAFIRLANGEEHKGATAVKDHLRRITGLTPEMLSFITYRQQREKGMFLSMRDSEKKEFLSTLLGLDVYEAEAEAARKRAAEQESTIAGKQAKLNVLREQVERDRASLSTTAVTLAMENVEQYKAALTLTEERAQAARATVANLEAEESAAHAEAAADKAAVDSKFTTMVQALEAQAERLRGAVDDPVTVNTGERDRLETLLAEVRRRRKIMADADDARRQQQRARLADVEGKLRPLRDTLAKVEQVANQQGAKVAMRAELAKSLCPTCKRPWEETRREMDRLDHEIADIEQWLARVEGVEAQAKALEAERAGLMEFTADPQIAKYDQAEKQVLGDLAAEKQRLSGEVERAQAGRRVEAAQAARDLADARSRWATAASQSAAARRAQDLAARLREARREMAEADSSIGRAKQDHALAIARLQNARDQHDAAQARLAAAENAVASAAEELKQAEVARAAEADFHQMVGREGFLGSIFDQVLDEIAEVANEVLAAIPNVSRCTIQFPSDQVSKSTGNVRKEIKAIATVDGHEGPYKAVLSGGMQAAFELAVDLAVRVVVSRRTGSFPGWLFLDEALDGLGPVEKEPCFHVLSKFAEEMLILVVDHSTEFKELFSKTIRIVMEGGRSRVE